MPRPIRERDLVLERIKVATDAATRAPSTLFAVGAVVVVVVVGGVARVTVRATATATGTATAVITIATVIANVVLSVAFVTPLWMLGFKAAHVGIAAATALAVADAEAIVVSATVALALWNLSLALTPVSGTSAAEAVCSDDNTLLSEPYAEILA